LIGNFYKQFYVYKEDIQILTFQPDQLNFLIYDKNFENSLRPILKKVKDILVTRCTVALRYSDIINLYTCNLEVNGNEIYLNVQSQKTKVYTRIKLPDYVIAILINRNVFGLRSYPLERRCWEIVLGEGF